MSKPKANAIRLQNKRFNNFRDLYEWLVFLYRLVCKNELCPSFSPVLYSKVCHKPICENKLKGSKRVRLIRWPILATFQENTFDLYLSYPYVTSFPALPVLRTSRTVLSLVILFYFLNWLIYEYISLENITLKRRIKNKFPPLHL